MRCYNVIYFSVKLNTKCDKKWTLATSTTAMFLNYNFELKRSTCTQIIVYLYHLR